jgi:sigma-B regulation protein RsbU (phosphoserine phosphatase)
MKRIVLTCLFILAGTLQAQNFDLNKDRQPVASIDGLWRFHLGDDPAWAAPGFDDSTWKLLRSDHSWAYQGYRGLSGYAWYRFTVMIPAGSQPTSLLLSRIFTGYRAYVDGQLAGGDGAIAPALINIQLPRTARIPLTSTVTTTSRKVQVAIRVWHSPIWASYISGGPKRGNLVGDDRLIVEEQSNRQRALNDHYVDLYLSACIRGIVGLTILGLFLLRPREREYLWFALIQLFGGADDVLEFFHSAYAFLPVQIDDVVDAAFAAGFWIAGFYFFTTVLGQHKDRLWRIVLILALMSPLMPILYWFGWVTVPVSGTLETLCVLPSLIWVLFFLTLRAVRRDPNARLLIIPTLLVYGFYLAFSLTLNLGQFGLWPNAPDLLNYRLPLVPFDLGIYTILNLVFLLAMLAFLIRRFTLARGEEERMRGEFEAARQVQSLLIPSVAASTPGFTIESVYLPAQEVGGDFYQVIPAADGSLLVLVGDVSGKGLQAAMTVSTIVGGLRDFHERQPCAILAHLNRVLHGQITGFATCCAALITSDGTLKIANAGHLSPYRDGKELDVEGGLPLGLTSDAEYTESTFTLQTGHILTFLSDGVIEATNAEKTLFGFDRAEALSDQPAQAIAEAARNFGQEDDITVVQLTLLASAVVG